VLKVERLIEKVEKNKVAETPANNARRGSEMLNLSGSGDSRRGSAIGLATMLMQGKNAPRRQSSRQF